MTPLEPDDPAGDAPHGAEPDAILAAWAARRAAPDVPAGFSARVLTALPDPPPAAETSDPCALRAAGTRAPRLTRMLATPAARAALLLVTAAACLLRIACALAHLVPWPGDTP